jgi:TPR repeat protein
MNQSEFERLWSAAQSDNAQAQEILAELFASAGRAEEARQWMTRAARANRAAAATRLGLWEIVGFGGIRNIARGLARILACADAGHAEAAHTAAILYAGGVGAPRDSREGLRRLAQAARLGHVRATSQLGLLIGPAQLDGIRLLRRAASSGSASAMYALRRDLADRDESQAWLAAAAATGHPLAAKQADRGAIRLPEAREEPDWDRLSEVCDLAWIEQPFNRHIECHEPRIESLDRFLPLWVCDYVIGMAAPMLSRGKVVDEHGGESVREERSNAVMTFGLADSDFLLEMVNLRTARAVDMPPENAEGLGVLHYLPGESYAPHADYIPDTPENAAQLAERGQRARTLLIYLNEEFTGGETAFPHLNLRFKPPAGAALIFHNVNALGLINAETLHAGMPPTSGQKWLISKWFRTKALRPGPPPD